MMIAEATPAVYQGREDAPRGVKFISSFRLGIFARDGFTCQYCGCDLLRDASTLYNASVDHVRPKSKGGTADPSNLVASCYACNAFKRDFLAADVEEGRAYVAAQRAAFVGFFVGQVESLGLEIPPRPAGQNSFRSDMVAALGGFAEQAAQLVHWLRDFQDDASRVLGRLEAVEATETTFDGPAID